MPDNEDHQDLARLLADPSAWTPDDARFMRFALTNQRRSVEECHPKDARRRAQLAAVADDIEAAVRDYERAR